MKIIVSGATGFVGRNVISYLGGKGHEIIALSSNINAKVILPDMVKLIHCNIGDYEKLKENQDLRNGDIFFHFAWMGTSGSKRADLKIQTDNILATQKAVELAHSWGCKRFVFAGSIMEYEIDNYLRTKNPQPGMGSIYSVAKLAANDIAKIVTAHLGMEYIHLIISNIYGPGEQSERFLNNLIREMVAGKAIDLTEARQLYDFIYIKDGAEAIGIAGINGIAGESYYIGNSDQKPLREYVEIIARVTGRKSELRYGALQYHGVINPYADIDTRKMEREQGFCPRTDFQTGVAGMVDCIKGEK